MQVNMAFFNNISEAPVKQQDNNAASSGASFKSAVNSAVQKSKYDSSDKGEAQKTDTVSGKNEETIKDDKKEETKSKDLNDNLRILLTELLNGKIDFSKLSATVKDEIQSLIKSKITSDGVDDKKLTEAVGDLFKNLLSGQENVKSEALPYDKTSTPLSKFNDEIVKLLKDADVPGKLNDETLIKTLDEADMNIISTLKAENKNIDKVGTGSDYLNMFHTSKTTGDTAQKRVVGKTSEDSPLEKTDKETDSKNTYKTVKPSSGEELQSFKEKSSKQEQSLNSDEKKQDLVSGSDDGFLKNLISDNKDNKISRISNFMTQFNNTNTDNPVMQDGSIVVNRATFSNDMLKAIKYMEADGVKDLTVKIMPKELGEVVIKLTMEGGVMKANITASNKDAYNLLNSSIKDISDKLQDSNIKIQNFNVNVYEDTTFFRDKSNSQNRENYNSERQKNDAIREIGHEEITTDNLDMEDDSSINMLI